MPIKQYKDISILVIGCGSIGRRRVESLLGIGVGRVSVCDIDAQKLQVMERDFGIDAFPSVEKALVGRPSAVFVSTTAASHIPLALEAVDAGCHIFIEKPLSISLDGCEELRKKAEKSGCIVQVGYSLRFHPAFIEMKRIVDSGKIGAVLSAHAEFGLRLEKWWPGRDYRDSYMARADLGGGLLLDVSHEIDLVKQLLGDFSEVVCLGGENSGIEIDSEDVVKMILRARQGAIVTISLDCLQSMYTRHCKIVGTEGMLFWDCPEGRLDRSLGRLRLSPMSTESWEEVPIQSESPDIYFDEVRHFLDCLQSGKSPVVGLEDGIRVLEIVRGAKESSRNGRVVCL